jgi:hypothetical protein
VITPPTADNGEADLAASSASMGPMAPFHKPHTKKVAHASMMMILDDVSFT